MKVKELKKAARRTAVSILCMGIIFSGVSCHVRAEGKAVILQSVAKGENICLFLSGLEEYGSVNGQIGRDAIEIVKTEADICGHTIILIDNSLSVTKDNLAKSKEILKQFVEGKAEDEKISLAIYGTDIQYLVEKETDAAKVIEALEGITSEDKDTYLTDVLYDELQKLESKTEYTSFIVVTDGVDNKAIGYTKEELSAYLKDNAYPVYALGCKYKDNDEQLKSLFAISRTTNAGYYLLDDYEEYDEIIEGLCEAITSVEIKVPDELKDGSARNILLTFETADGTVEVSGNLSMPFGLREEEPGPEEMPEEEAQEAVVEEESVEEAPAEEAAPESAEVEEHEPDIQEEKASADWISIGAGIVIAAALSVLVFVNIQKKKKGEGKGNDGKKDIKRSKGKKKQDEIASPPVEDTGSTILGAFGEDDGGTVFLDSRERAGYIVVLRDNNDSGRIFRYPLSDKVVIGRKYQDGVNIVLHYESTISARHCEISVRGDRFYIRDLNSSNKTFLNGQQVRDYMEFTSGSTIQMGNLKMTLEIEQVR